MHKLILSVGLSALLLVFHANAKNADVADNQNEIFAQINDLTIRAGEFQAIFRAAVRQKYYHGKVPDAELETFRQQVIDDIITQVLVHDEALTQGLQPDRKKIDAAIDAFTLNNSANPAFLAQRETLVAQMQQTLERRDLLEKMEAKIKDLPAPGAAQIKQYYLDHPAKFTEPERLWLSVILLKVPPYAPEGTWVEAQTAAFELKRRIESGEDFALLAKQMSDHPSAGNGGDLGYLHRGVLEPDVQKKIESLAIDQLSEPIRILDGITLFRLNGIQAAQLKSFDEVETRAAGLLYRELQEDSWNIYVKNLRASARVDVHE
jgi:parvulin-like peptidyl-prolyl isomerase